MGFGPQVADFDGDGRRDVATGSWPGELYFFKGGEKGFAAAGTIRDAQGAPIRHENASALAAADWDRDGDVDLVCGFISGTMLFFANESKEGTLAFASGKPVMADGKPIACDHAGPCVADWDGDGDEDLLVGSESGGVVLYRAQRDGDKGLPGLSAAETLVEPAPANKRWAGLKLDAEGNLLEARPGVRSKPCVADWNGDGKPDLLVGDFTTLKGPEPELTEEQRARRKELERKVKKGYEEQGQIYVELDRAVKSEMGLGKGKPVPKERMEEYGRLLGEKQKEHGRHQEVLELIRGWSEELKPLRAEDRMAGFVWVFERK